MSTINRIPKGLQSLFGNTAQGKNPSELLQDVRPSIDLSNLWGIEQTKTIRFNGSFAAAFQRQIITVPEGEMWLLLAISAECVVNNTEFIGFSLGISTPSGTFEQSLAHSNPYATAGTTMASVAGHTFPYPFPITAGEFVYTRCQQFDAVGAHNMNLTTRHIRLEI